MYKVWKYKRPKEWELIDDGDERKVVVKYRNSDDSDDE